MFSELLNSCYNYPLDLLSIVTISVVLNIILGIALVRRTSKHIADISTLNKLLKVLEKDGLIK